MSLAAAVVAVSAGKFWGALGAGAGAGLLAFWFGFRHLARARFIEDLPTSQIRSAAQGYVEFAGRVRWMSGPEIVSPLSGQPCVWWRYKVEERRGSGRNRHWTTIDSGESDDLFLLGDQGGECIVDPVGARVFPSLDRTWQGSAARPGRIPVRWTWFTFGNYRYSEQLLQRGAPLVAIGWFRSQGAIQDLNESRDIAALLGEWKRDRPELLHRFDADRNGEIDLQEWEAARRAAGEEVRLRHVEAASHPDIDVLCRPPDGRPFFLSAVPQSQLIRRYRRWALSCLTLSALLGALVMKTLVLRGLL